MSNSLTPILYLNRAFKSISCTLLYLLTLTGLPDLAWAAPFSWNPPASDQSVVFLGEIFGTVGGVLAGAPNAIIGNLFYIFNIAVLSIGSLVVSYTIVLTTINTAQEGEVMGRKWSSVWIPIRAATGIAFLLPTPSGYSIIQIMIMKAILMSIAAADQVWTQVSNALLTGQGALGTYEVDKTQLDAASRSLLESMVCAQVFNRNPVCSAAIGGKQVTAYGEEGHLIVGVLNDVGNANLCGGIRAGNTPPNVDRQTWQNANLLAFNYAVFGLNQVALEIYNAPDAAGWSIPNPITTASNSIGGTLSSVQPIPQSNTTANTDAGWIYAGSYYFSLISKTGVVGVYPAPTSFAGNTTQVGNQCTQILNNYMTRTAQYLQVTQMSPQTGLNNTAKLELNSPSFSQPFISSIYNTITQPVRDAILKITMLLTTVKGDPISSLRAFGSFMMSVTENLWFAVMVVSALAIVGSCLYSGVMPQCWALGVILTILIPILTIFIVLFWGMGATMGIYLPLIPYLVYTFAAVSWFVLVVEAIAAAPIISLGLVSPSQEHLGKASGAILLLSNIFLRPSLMIIGFVAAIKLAGAIINMVNYGFAETVKVSTAGIGIFGCFALIGLYVGIIIAVIHESFTLIHALPDRVIRWIGGTPEHSATSKAHLEEVQKAGEKGAEQGSTIMKGSAGFAEEKVGKKIFTSPVAGLIQAVSQ